MFTKPLIIQEKFRTKLLRNFKHRAVESNNNAENGEAWYFETNEASVWSQADVLHLETTAFCACFSCDNVELTGSAITVMLLDPPWRPCLQAPMNINLPVMSSTYYHIIT